MTRFIYQAHRLGSVGFVLTKSFNDSRKLGTACPKAGLECFFYTHRLYIMTKVY